MTTCTAYSANASNTPTALLRKIVRNIIWICMQQKFNIHAVLPFLSSRLRTPNALPMPLQTQCCKGKRSVSLEINVILVYQNAMTMSVCSMHRVRLRLHHHAHYCLLSNDFNEVKNEFIKLICEQPIKIHYPCIVQKKREVRLYRNSCKRWNS